MKQRILWWATGFGLVALFLSFRYVDLAALAGPDLCLFHRFTGHACPGCGLTRAMAALARGELGRSFALHPLTLLLVAEVGLVWWAWGRTLAGDPGIPPRTQRTMAWGTAALLLAVWVLRAALGQLPA